MKVFITGGNGMVGRAVKEVFKEYEIIAPSRKELDLENSEKVLSYMIKYRPNLVIHLAAKVGGVLGNSKFLADFYIENIRINTNVLDACFKADVDKIISILSTCVYPDKVEYPLTEDQLHNGFPHLSNFTYAFTKRMLDVQSRAYRKQYGRNFISVIPNNIYGPNDQYGYGCHVIPDLMKRFHEAKIFNKSYVEVWGSGKCLREFTYSYDIANYIYYIFKHYDEEEPINIGNNKEYSIEKLANLIRDVVGFKGEIVFNTEKMEGQLRKPSDITKFRNLLDKNNIKISKISLEDGLMQTYSWFVMNYPKLRGII